MINIEKACEIATKERKEPFIDVITDIGNAFVIGTVAENGDVAEQFPVIVNKDNGRTEIFCIPDHIEKIKTGKSIKVPSRYRLKKL